MTAGRGCGAFVALGSNLDSPQRQVLRAMDEIDALPATQVLRRSSLYRSAAVGNPNQPDFINAAVYLETELSAGELLSGLLAIEQRHGRVRGEPNAPRTLDLDLLLYGDRTIDSPSLRIPHPRMHERAFVLQPLAEIAPDAVVPGHGPLGALLPAVAAQRVERIHAG